MAGLGRRTHYRKHLTDEVLYDFPEPKEDERFAKVVGTRGSNQFDILLASSDSSSSDKSPQLAILPTKFRKLVWVKRNDYVIVQTGGDDEDEEDDTGGIRYIITHILYKEQVKHLRSKGLWPANDPEFADGAADNQEKTNTDAVSVEVEKDSEDSEPDDGIVYDTAYDDDADLFVNTNRIAKLTIQDSSDSENESDED